MAESINGGYEYSTTPYVPKGAEDNDGTTKATTRRGVTLRNTLLAAAGGVVLAATLTACGPSGEAPTPAPTTSETDAPAEGELMTPEELSNEVVLSAEKYTTPEEVAQAFMDVSISGLYNTMEAEAAYDTYRQNDRDISATVEQLNRPLDDAFFSTVFVEDWKSNENLIYQSLDNIDNHRLVSELNFATTYKISSDSNDKEPYAAEFKLNSSEISDVTETSFTATIVRQYTDNRDQNRALELVEGNAINNEPLQPEIVKFVLVDGTWKIADWTIGF